jgi:hypothetical protein
MILRQSYRNRACLLQDFAYLRRRKTRGVIGRITDPTRQCRWEDEDRPAGLRHLRQRSTAMSDKTPWYPNLEEAKEFTDHPNPALGKNPPLRIPLANEDTAPLQGSKDLSDDDSLEDVVAASYDADDADEDPPGK